MAGLMLAPIITEDDTGQMWMMTTGTFALFFQPGLALVEAGSIRAKNITNMMLKNLLCFSAGCTWWLLGWGFTGVGIPSASSIIGVEDFLMVSTGGGSYPFFFYQLALATASVAIVGGAMAGRTKLWVHIVYACMMAGFTYPLVVHWVWDVDGILYKWEYMDFGGAGVVHVVGGWTALIGAWMVGPRMGRFTDEFDDLTKYPEPTIALKGLGALFMLFGFLGANLGGTRRMSGEMTRAAQAVVTTCISASAGAAASFMWNFIVFGEYATVRVVNGFMAGLVVIAGGCNFITPGGASVAGSSGALVCEWASMLLEYLHIDDPSDAFAIHGAAGFWGTLAAGYLLHPMYLPEGMAADGQFVKQMWGVGAIVTWSVLTATMMFYTIDMTIGLRLEYGEEKGGFCNEPAPPTDDEYEVVEKENPVAPASITAEE